MKRSSIIESSGACQNDNIFSIPSKRDEGSVDSRPSAALHQLQFLPDPVDSGVSVMVHGLGVRVGSGLLLDFLGLHGALGPLGTCQSRQTRWSSLARSMFC